MKILRTEADMIFFLFLSLANNDFEYVLADIVQNGRKDHARSSGTPRVSTWWCHQMETLFALLAICAGNSPATGELPSQRPVTRSFDVFFDLRLNKRLSKQSRRRWFETQSRSSWRHCNVYKSLALEIRAPRGACFVPRKTLSDTITNRGELITGTKDTTAHN